MNKFIVSLMLLVSIAGVSQAQLQYGASATNYPVCSLSLSNVMTLAPAVPNLVTRTLINTAGVDMTLAVFTSRPIVIGSPFYNSLIVSNAYVSGYGSGSTTNSVTTIGLQTNSPPNSYYLSTTNSLLGGALFKLSSGTSTTITIGAELFGVFTNTTASATNAVFVNDVYLQR